MFKQLINYFKKPQTVTVKHRNGVLIITKNGKAIRLDSQQTDLVKMVVGKL